MDLIYTLYHPGTFLVIQNRMSMIRHPLQAGQTSTAALIHRLPAKASEMHHYLQLLRRSGRCKGTAQLRLTYYKLSLHYIPPFGLYRGIKYKKTVTW